MSESIKGTVYGKTVELERPLALPDGTSVLLSVEPLPGSEEERRRWLLELCGAWKHDPSLAATFEAIAQERRTHHEREVRIG